MVFSVMARAIGYNGNDPERIHHLIKVHSFARIIAKSEGFDESNQKITEIAAILHDIGIHNCLLKYHSIDGQYQELEGQIVAKEILDSLHIPTWIAKRVCYIVGHHHTLKAIDGMDFQVVVEADILVNIYDKNVTDKERIRKIKESVFKTKKGKQLLEQMYLAEY